MRLKAPEPFHLSRQAPQAWRLLGGWLCALLVGWASLVQGAPSKDEVSAREQDLKQLRGRIGELRTQLDSAQGKQERLTLELQTVESDIGALTQRLRALNDSLAHQRKALKRLDGDRRQQEQKLALHQGALVDQVRAAYAMGRQDRMKILLNQQDPAVASRVMVYYDYFNRARSQRLALISDLIARLQKTEAEATQSKSRLLELQARELEQKRRLEQAQLTRRQVIQGLKTEIKGKGLELDKLKKDEGRLQELLARLQQEAKAPPVETEKRAAFQTLKGALPWPAKGRLAARFGQERKGGLLWDGVMIAAPEGQEVQAISHGRVAFADWLRGFGLLLIVDHGDGYMSLYGHNQSLFKEVGDWVEQGEAVALVGNSGGQSNAGVYFSLRHKGQPINPNAWCKRAKGDRIGQQWMGIEFLILGLGAHEAVMAAES